ncbi:MAG: EI24 domain-containing protein [Deltaproteobacteria bacterium]|nr:EI24 domain-containing protein [Deltaproteobacteria bacterium]
MIPGAAKSAVKTFRDGMAAFFKGQRYVISTHSELLKYCLIPMTLGTVVFVALGVAFVFNIDDLLQLIWGKPTHIAWQILWYVFATVTVVLSAGTTVLLAYLIFMILCAPFNDLLSEKVEEIEGTFTVSPFDWSFFVRDAWHSVAVEFMKMLQKLAWLTPLYLISLIIPVVGQIVYAVIGGYKMSFWLGVDYVDWALARRGYTAKERLLFAREHRSALRGFGLMMTLASLIPLCAVICWPGAVAGGTLLCTGLSPLDRRKGGDHAAPVELGLEERKN